MSRAILNIEKEYNRNNIHKQIIASCTPANGLSPVTLVGLLTEDFGLDISNTYTTNDENLLGDTKLGNMVNTVSNVATGMAEKIAGYTGTDVRLSKESALQHWEDAKRWSFTLNFELVNTRGESQGNMALLKQVIKLNLPKKAGTEEIQTATNIWGTMFQGQKTWLTAPAGYGISSWQAAKGEKSFQGTWSVQIGRYMRFNDLICTSCNFKLSKERSRTNGEPIWIQLTMSFEPAGLPTVEDVDGWFSTSSSY